MKQSVLLCGGPDKCGKTTILKEVSRRTGIPVFKPSNMHENFVSQQDKFIQELRHSDFRMVDMLRQMGSSVLVDRAYMCEWVYSRFFFRDTDMAALRRLDRAFADLGARILICTRDSFRGFADDLNRDIDEQGLVRLRRLYNEFTLWTACEHKVLYVDDNNLDRHAYEVMKFMGVTDVMSPPYAVCNDGSQVPLQNCPDCRELGRADMAHYHVCKENTK